MVRGLRVVQRKNLRPEVNRECASFLKTPSYSLLRNVMGKLHFFTDSGYMNGISVFSPPELEKNIMHH